VGRMKAVRIVLALVGVQPALHAAGPLRQHRLPSPRVSSGICDGRFLNLDYRVE